MNTELVQKREQGMIVPKEAFGNNYGGILLVGLVYKKRFGKMPNHKKGGFYVKRKDQ